jgi:hypothetical protein
MPDIKNIVLSTPAEALEGILSPFIEDQFPSFARSDYRKLILFIKAYYEWSEKQGNPSFVNSKLGEVMDVDNSLEQFYSHFKSQYLDSFPEQLAVSVEGSSPNRRTLVKKIKEFYGEKGTESAYRFLFRILYDSNVQFLYPKNFILRTSDGEWIEEKSVKVTRQNEQYHDDLVGGRIEQYNGTVLTGSANIDRVFKYYQDGVPVTELFLTSIVGTILPNQSVVLSPASDSGVSPFTETTFSVLGEFFVQTPGANYSVGDTVYISAAGVGFSAKVEQTGLAGAVKRIRIENSGVNYFDSVTALVVSANGTNNTARVLLSPTAITNYPGYYKGNRGKISSTQKLYDGDFYQEYSYILKSAVSIDKYYSILRKLIHPAGMKMFGSILLESVVDSPSGGSSQVTRVGVPVLGNYTPYTLGTTFDLRNNGVTAAGRWFFNDGPGGSGGITRGATGDLYPVGYNPYIGSSAEIGPSGISSPTGTLFRMGGSGGFTGLGYTYCFVPEGGRTAHNPLGAPLGGITAWLRFAESKLTPDVVGTSPKAVVGLTLWLKPENIGVCGGSMITGRCMDIWRDASPSQNHALPPKWSMWTTNPSFTGVTVDKLRPTLVVADRGIAGRTGIQFNGGVVYGPNTVWLQAGVCGGHTAGTTLGALASDIPFEPGKTGERILSGQFFTLTRGLTLTKDMTAFIVFRAGVTANGATATGYTGSNHGLGFVSSDKPFHQFAPATMYYPLFGTTDGNLVTEPGVTLWTDSLSGTGIAVTENANVTDPNGNTTASSVTFNAGAGTATPDWAFKSRFISDIASGTPYTFSVWMKGSVGGEKIVVRGMANTTYTLCNLTTKWQRFVITETAATTSGTIQIGIRQNLPVIGIINSTATVYLWNPQLQSGSSSTLLTSVSGGESDHAFYNRSYYDVDIDSNKQNSTFYFVNSITSESLYPYETGLVGFRSNRGSTGSERIAYNPYQTTLTGVSLQNIIVGEWNRSTDSRIQSFHNGTEAKNLSITTSRRIARPTSPGGSSQFNIAASESAYNSEPVSLSRFGSYLLPVLDSPYGITSANFVSYALLNPSYSFRGVIYEVIVYDRVLTETERQVVYCYLSKKYRLDDVLPYSYTCSHPSADVIGFAYWDISKHPNTAGSANILAGTSFGNITIQDFLNLYGIIYKSAGTRLSDGTILTQDTYTVLGE